MYNTNLFLEEGIDTDALFFRLYATRDFSVWSTELDKALDESYFEDERPSFHVVDETVDDKHQYTIKHLSNGQHCVDLLEEEKPGITSKDKLRVLKLQLYEDHQEVRDLRAMKSKAKTLVERKNFFLRIREVQQAIKEKRYQVKMLAK